MKQFFMTAIVAAFFGSLTACASGPSYDELVAQANKEISVAKSMKYLWRDTGKLMKQAAQAKETGNTGTAKKLVQKALDQARLAQQQAKEEANPTPKYF